MGMSERLEEIKKSAFKKKYLHQVNDKVTEKYFYKLTEKDFDWLIQQAEYNNTLTEQIDVTQRRNERLEKRVEELEEENKQIKTAYQDRVDDIESMREMLGLTWEHFQDETGKPIEKLQGDEINRLQEDNQRYKRELENLLTYANKQMERYGDRYGQDYDFERYDEVSMFATLIEQALEQEND